MPPRRHAYALLLCGVALFAIGLLGWAAGIDLPLHRALRLVDTGSWPQRVVALSVLGGLSVMGPVALIVAAVLAARRRARDAIWLVAAIVGGRLAVELLKELVRRPRPPIADRLAQVGSWSFPSSHSAGTMMTVLALAWLAGGGPRAIGVALAAAVLIGWTRVALGVHWPSDVLAGWGFGMAWIGAAAMLRHASERTPGQRRS